MVSTLFQSTPRRLTAPKSSSAPPTQQRTMCSRTATATPEIRSSIFRRRPARIISPYNGIAARSSALTRRAPSLVVAGSSALAGGECGFFEEQEEELITKSALGIGGTLRARPRFSRSIWSSFLRQTLSPSASSGGRFVVGGGPVAATSPRFWASSPESARELSASFSWTVILHPQRGNPFGPIQALLICGRSRFLLDKAEDALRVHLGDVWEIKATRVEHRNPGGAACVRELVPRGEEPPWWDWNRSTSRRATRRL